jgi:hypothetical protein
MSKWQPKDGEIVWHCIQKCKHKVHTDMHGRFFTSDLNGRFWYTIDKVEQYTEQDKVDTALQWLISKMKEGGLKLSPFHDLIDKALDMERGQITSSFVQGYYQLDNDSVEESAEEYYIRIYKLD